MASTDHTTAPVLVRIPDAAAALGVCRRTVCSMIASGQMPAYKVRGATVIRRSDINAFVASLQPVKIAA